MHCTKEGSRCKEEEARRGLGFKCFRGDDSLQEAAAGLIEPNLKVEIVETADEEPETRSLEEIVLSRKSELCSLGLTAS